MSDQRPTSLSVLYYDPEAEQVPEPEPVPETPAPKRRGRPPGARNKPKDPTPKRDIPWFRIFWSVAWWAVAWASVASLYWGVQGWLGQSAAYITLSVSVVVATYILYRLGMKMREPL